MHPLVIVPTVVPKSVDDILSARQRYAFATTLHIDVADGVFAKNTTWTPPPGYKLPDTQSVAYEVHLMAERPLSLGLAYAHAGARLLIGHIEAFGNSDTAQDTFKMWRGAGVTEIGAALLLETPPKELIPYAELIDFVHVMTISEIGEQGHPFYVRSIERITRLHAQFPNLTLSVDGGVGVDNISALLSAGVTRFCVGRVLQASNDPQQIYDSLGALCTSA